MLTPEIDDKNRDAELKRKAKDPRSFGTPRLDTKEVSERKLEGHKLVTEQGLKEPRVPAAENTLQETEEERRTREEAEQKAKAEEARIRKEWEEYLDQPVGVIIGELHTVQSKEQLTVMQAIEAETKNRKTLIEAIAAEIAKRDE